LPLYTRGLTSLAHLLSLAQVWLIHSLGYSSNGSGPKKEIGNAYVEIPISNELLQASDPLFHYKTLHKQHRPLHYGSKYEAGEKYAIPLLPTFNQVSSTATR
jgi:hypothetical protein